MYTVSLKPFNQAIYMKKKIIKKMKNYLFEISKYLEEKIIIT